MEIISPRTAEKPGPTKFNEDSCCEAKSPSGTNEEVGEHAGNSYIPTVISLALLLAGMGLDYFKVSWFTEYLR
jgi:Zn2+/Cd2+-exporting ATPase